MCDTSQRRTVLRGSATDCQSQHVETEFDGVVCVHGTGPHGENAQERQNDGSDRNAGSGCAAAGRGHHGMLDFTRDIQSHTITIRERTREVLLAEFHVNSL